MTADAATTLAPSRSFFPCHPGGTPPLHADAFGGGSKHLSVGGHKDHVGPVRHREGCSNPVTGLELDEGLPATSLPDFVECESLGGP
ncbi:MAG: hypothetical protein Ct9H300mP12_13000 [Acidimicrobiales bacterium]|nr:MAG: hypothetical protein Ct9H300mP12_13000 [Acidimicrobiales bacterium]